MRFSENPSWELRLGVPEDLNLALFVRSSCDFKVSGLPDLIGAALDDGFDLGATRIVSDHALSSQEWSEWWSLMSRSRSGLLSAPTVAPLDPPDFETLTDPLRQACSLVWPQFRSWWGGPEGREQRLAGALQSLAGIPNQLVADHEHRQRRACRPFRFDIDVLAVDSMDVVEVDDAYAQIGAPLLTDRMAFASWFRAVLRRIG